MNRSARTVLITLAWLLASSAQAATTQPAPGGVSILVRPITDPRLPTFTDAELTDALGRASQRIIDAGGPKVLWKMADPIAADKFAADLDARIAPTRLQFYDGVNPMTLSEGEVAKAILPICKSFGTIEQIRSLIGTEAVAVAGSYEALAAVMAKRYLAQFRLLVRLKDPGGNLVTEFPTTRCLFRLTTWDMVQAVAGPDAPWTLDLFNGLLLEDTPYYSAPHALTTGVAFGLSDLHDRQSVVGYGSILLDDPSVQTLRMGKLTRSQQLDALAYIIAHEAGLHIALNLADDYAPTAGIARTLATLRSPADLVPLPGVPTARRVPPPDQLAPGKIRTRAKIAAARHDIAAFEAEVRFASKLKIADAEKVALLEILSNIREQMK